jgi:hypothetical protein
MKESERKRREQPDEKLAALMDEFEGRMVSPGGAAALLGVSRKTIHTLCKREVLRSFVSDREDKWGPVSYGPRWIYIPLEDVYAYAGRTDRETAPLKRWKRWLPKSNGGQS